MTSFRRFLSVRLISAVLVAILLAALGSQGHTHDLKKLNADPTAYLNQQRNFLSKGFGQSVTTWICLVAMIVILYEVFNYGIQRPRFKPNVARAFYARGIIRGGILLLRPGVALEMVERARALGVRVLGVDAFSLTPTTTQPNLAQSLDLARGPSASSDCWDTTRAFITERLESDLYFEVVVE